MKNVHSQGGAIMENGKRVRVLLRLNPTTSPDSHAYFGFTHMINTTGLTFESQERLAIGDEANCIFDLPKRLVWNFHGKIKITNVTDHDQQPQLYVYDAEIISAEQLDEKELLEFVETPNDPTSPTAEDDYSLKAHLAAQGANETTGKTLIEKLTSRLMEQDFAEYMAKRVIEEFKQAIHNRTTRSIHWIQHIEGRKAIYWEHDFSKLLKDTFTAMELPSSLCLPPNKDRFEHLVKVHFDNEPSVYQIYVSVKLHSDHRRRLPDEQFIVSIRIILNDN